MNWRVVAGGMLLAVTLTAAGCGSSPPPETFTGTVEVTQVDVGAEIGGRIASLFVEEGEKVSAGQAVIRMEAATLSLQLEQAQAAVASSRAKLLETESGATSNEIHQVQAEVSAVKAQLEGAEKALAIAKDQLDRIKALHDAGTVSPQELDNTQAQYDQKLTNVKSAKAQLEAAAARLNVVRSGAKEETLEVLRANVVQAEKTVAIARENLEKAKVLAPVSGIATSVNVEPGEMVNAGAALLTISDLSNLWVEVYIPEKYLDRVNVGEEALISITSAPDKNFKGKVTFIAAEAEFTPERANTQEERADTVFKVRVKITEALDKFKPGMSAEVSFPRLAKR